jgi:hypothetical protein
VKVIEYEGAVAAVEDAVESRAPSEAARRTTNVRRTILVLPAAPDRSITSLTNSH